MEKIFDSFDYKIWVYCDNWGNKQFRGYENKETSRRISSLRGKTQEEKKEITK